MRCTICTRRLPDATDRYACEGCEYAMRAALEQLLTELPALRASLAPGSAPGGRRPVGRAHSPMPVSLPVLDLLGPGTVAYCEDPYGEQTADIPLAPLLLSWAQHLAHDYPAVYRRGGTEYRQPCEAAVARRHQDLPGWITWLARYLPYAATRPWVVDLHDALEDAVRRVRAVTGTRPQTHPRLAPCPRCSAFGLGRTDGQWHVVCQACGHRMEPDAYAAHAAAVLPALTMTMIRLAGAETAQGAA
jgi:hypothetical protein